MWGKFRSVKTCYEKQALTIFFRWFYLKKSISFLLLSMIFQFVYFIYSKNRLHTKIKMCRSQNVLWPICSLFIHCFVSCIQLHISNSIEHAEFIHFRISFFFYIISRLIIYIWEHVERWIESGLSWSGLIEIQSIRDG